MSYTARRLQAVREAACSCPDARSAASFDTRLRDLASYLIGRFA